MAAETTTRIATDGASVDDASSTDDAETSPDANSGAADSRKSAAASVATRFVPEIAGLRTVALLLVASFHIWLGKVSGGVDIFLFIGAYLMTRSLIGRAEAGELTRPVTFVVRKFARLLPTALAAIALTVVAVLLLTPARTWETLFDQALASGTYWMNFWLQGEAVNYYATDRHESSFFQHYWSLSLQGQVFVLWPLVHLACDWIARKASIRPRRLLLGVFGVVTISSFIWALHLTADNAEFAYFDLPARLWEFALGSLLALVIPWIRFPTLARRIMTIIGLAGAIACGFVMPVDATYPGWPALWPIGCALLVIAAADAPRREGTKPDPLLGHPILRFLGGYTYALYLTHWPVLVLYANVTGNDVPNAFDGLLVLLISVAVAVLITHAVERPVSRWMRGERAFARDWWPKFGRRTLVIFTACAVVATGIGVGGDQGLRQMRASALDAIWLTDVSVRGPQAAPTAEFDSLVPADVVVSTPADFRGEWCPRDKWRAGLVCLEEGPTGDDAALAERDIVVIGSSHAMMYTGMLWETMQRHENWHMRAYGAPGCVAPDPGSTPTEECADMWETAIDYVIATQPDLLLIVGSISQPTAPDVLHDHSQSQYKTTVMGDHVETVEEVVSQSSTDVVVIRDTPRFPTAPYYCGAEKGFDSSACVFEAQPDPPTLPAFVDDITAAGGVWVDLTDSVCPDGVCRPTMGGIVTYLDDNHLTGTMSRSLAQAFADQVHPRVDWWPEQVWLEP
ncbi:MAG: acyltransferase family protein [Pseudoclavibacter sp.]